MLTCGFLVLLIVLIGIIVYLLRGNSEAFAIGVGPETNPPFIVPADLPPPTPPGRWPNANWGYRDNCATLQTLLWEQERPWVCMPEQNPFAATLVRPMADGSQGLIGYYPHLENSQPITKQYTKCGDNPNGPHYAKNSMMQMNSVPYASW